jgi:trigger factor
MQITETLSKGLKREFDVTVPATDIEAKLHKRLETIGKKVKIPGFRPGKAPLALLKQRYKNDALSEVLEECVDSGLKKLLKEKELKASLKPKINLQSYEDGKDLIFQVTMEVLPTIDGIDLEHLSFEKLVVTVPEEKITGVLENLAKKNRATRPLETPRKTQKGDIVIIDFEGFVEGEPIEGGSEKDHPLELGSGAFIPGFEDQLIGHHKGAQIEVKVTFPKDYHEDLYANKPARFDVTIKDIHEVDPISIDAALAEKLGFESLDAMKEWIEKGLSKDFEAQSFLNTKRHVLDALADRFAFDVPENMIELEFENIWGQLCRELGIEETEAANANLKEVKALKTFEETAGKSEKELRQEYKTIAERRVRLGILLAEIGNRNSIAISNQELMNALTSRAREFPGQEREVFDFYRNNESAMASLRAPIFENKVIEFILSQSQITEKPITPEELEKLLLSEEEEAEKKIAAEAKKAKAKKPSKEENN